MHDQSWDRKRCTKWLEDELLKQRRSRPRNRNEWAQFLADAGIPTSVRFLLLSATRGLWQLDHPLHRFLAEEINIPPVIAWDNGLLTLTVGGDVQRFRSDLDSYVLNMFEDRGWPPYVSNLFNDNFEAKRAARKLNRAVRRLKFYAKGRGIRFESIC